MRVTQASPGRRRTKRRRRRRRRRPFPCKYNSPFAIHTFHKHHRHILYCRRRYDLAIKDTHTHTHTHFQNVYTTSPKIPTSISNMMRVVPSATRALAFASSSATRQVMSSSNNAAVVNRYAFTALRMMSAAAPSVKVCLHVGGMRCSTLLLLCFLMGESW